jgi:hypothetical protein
MEQQQQQQQQHKCCVSHATMRPYLHADCAAGRDTSVSLDERERQGPAGDEWRDWEPSGGGELLGPERNNALRWEAWALEAQQMAIAAEKHAAAADLARREGKVEEAEAEASRAALCTAAVERVKEEASRALKGTGAEVL